MLIGEVKGDAAIILFFHLNKHKDLHENCALSRKTCGKRRNPE